MPNALQSLTIGAPAFLGLNTQDSPLSVGENYAETADNCVIDRYGRLGARKGRALVTETATELGSSAGLETIYHYVVVSGSDEGSELVFSAGNNKILSGTTTLVDETPSGYSITANNWQVAEQAGHVYFFQKNHEPLVYSDDTEFFEPMSSHTGATGTPPEANCVLAAFGRLWAGDIANDEGTLYWSDTLLGAQWSGGTSGSIDLANVWPNGYDSIVAVEEHNDFLVIFGRRSIVIYTGAEDPSTMEVYDTIKSVGCVDRDTVQSVVGELVFLSDRGLMGLGRVLQDGSAPLDDLSKNVRDGLLLDISDQTSPIKSVYSPEEAFYLLSFTDINKVWCFDVRQKLENNSFRTTEWTQVTLESFHRTRTGTLYLGVTNGLATYSGYQDEDSAYTMKYYTHPLSFGDPSRLKFLKSINITFIGSGDIPGTLFWSYNYGASFTSAQYTVSNPNVAEYNLAEYNIGEYTSGILFNKFRKNTTGSGDNVIIGLQALVDSQLVSIQQLDIKAVVGRGN